MAKPGRSGNIFSLPDTPKLQYTDGFGFNLYFPPADTKMSGKKALPDLQFRYLLPCFMRIPKLSLSLFGAG